MVQVVTSASESIDQAVIDAFAERPGVPCKVRVQPGVLRAPEGKETWLSWRGQHYMVEIETLEEAQEFRLALGAFFDVLKRDGIAALRKRLDAPA